MYELKKALRYLLNKWGAELVQATLTELIAHPSERYKALYPTKPTGEQKLP